jgi:AraC-like DNA-binding protein/quercetin dioxygenase-like cupin family protein
MVDIPLHREVRTAWTSIHEFVLPPGFRVPMHDHSPPHILVMLGGVLSERDGLDIRLCQPGSIRYSPGGDRHAVEISSAGAHCLVLEARGFPELRLIDRLYISAEEARDDVDALRALLFGEGRASPGMVEEHALSLFTMVRARARPDRVRHHRWIATARRCLDELDVSRAPLEDAARHVGRNSSVVARVFRATYGVSIHRYFRRRQIDRVWTLLSDGDDSLASIAARAGFTDQSHLTRAFTREVGASPAEVRASMRRTGADARNWYQSSALRPVHSPPESTPSRSSQANTVSHTPGA